MRVTGREGAEIKGKIDWGGIGVVEVSRRNGKGKAKIGVDRQGGVRRRRREGESGVGEGVRRDAWKRSVTLTLSP